MDKLYDQVQKYLNMDEEIPFKEFQQFYQDVISKLDREAESFEEDSIWKGLFVVESIMSNAENRAKTTKNASETKKYKKMAKRTKLYAQNFTKRLHQFGYTQEQIGEKFEQMLEEGTKEEVEE
ncbi:hypothetical protein [Alteribacillus sp. YIM 98480]|uniref:hypothetical protein n=1 Tax=Alteribacillus sp. YIM 98480 TaxID=2606599 RepID=UPI00131E246E|nr:hypothetical protein [Alteribacillus sp. YIM 98480]